MARVFAAFASWEEPGRVTPFWLQVHLKGGAARRGWFCGPRFITLWRGICECFPAHEAR